LLAAAAVIALMAGTLSLSERRATFVSAVTHELRTPLTTLRGNIHLLREDEAGAADSEHQAILADMAADTERMTRLVNDLLLLAEADAGLHLALETVDLIPLIRHAATLPHGCDSSCWLQRAEQHAAGAAIWLADHIEAPMHAVRAVHVGVSRRSKHDGVAFRTPAITMGSRLGMVVCLNLYNYTASFSAEKGRSNQVGSDVLNGTREKTSVE
jgi:hypothetical protein